MYKIKIINFKIIIKIILICTISIQNLKADFFTDISDLIENNTPRLSYGVAVTDIDNDDKFDFIVTGYRYSNLALSYKKNKLRNIINQNVFTDQNRQAIGVAACDVDFDGKEEIYILNTDSFSGKKIYADRLLDLNDNTYKDLFEDNINNDVLNVTAGRSVACVDRVGNGKYSVYVSNYGGPSKFYTINGKKIIDEAPKLNLDKITGGRAVVAGHILSEKMDIFASNERGANFLYKNINNKFIDVAKRYGVEDKYQNGRGTVLSDYLIKIVSDILKCELNNYQHKALHFWKYAMSEKNNNLGSLLDEDLKVIVCGDWCMNGKVEGGFLSAKDAANKLLKYI